MRALCAALLLASLASLASSAPDDAFRAWAKAHGKLYTAAEAALRARVFEENVAVARRLNAEGHGAHFGPNAFSDLTSAEFKALRTTELAARQPGHFAVVPDAVGESLDMRGWLPGVKDQQLCGSCWAFSAVANAEGAWYLRHREVVSLSEQQLVACDKSDSGCNGGLMSNADDYILKNGLATEASYPYTSGSGSVTPCRRYDAAYQFSASRDFQKVVADDDLIAYLQQYGPLSAAVEADRPVFQNYQSGILDSTQCGSTLDHGVTLVGYGTENGTPYWTVRNSWGVYWGEDGYIRLVRGKNMCGINGLISTIVA
eukprot:m51a1_g2115 putative cysteine peptidase precursor (315) ;mRNA; r:1656284-1657228